MNFNKISVLILSFFAVSAWPETHAQWITIHCPSVTAIQVTPIIEPSWASYKYQGKVAINFPALNDNLQLSGEGTAPTVITFHGATWTDRTFLCNYNEGLNAVVIFEIVLDQYVKYCYFSSSTSRKIFECHSSDPSQCLFTCELGQPES